MPEWLPQVGPVLISEDRIRHRVAELGRKITNDYLNHKPLVIGILRGAAIFHADLIRHLLLNLQIDFISVASYGASTETSGAVQLVKDLETDILGVDVLLVEDIIDTGLTLDYLTRSLSARNPASLKICSLLSKPDRHQKDVEIDYLGFEVPNKFVVGYGLDFNQHFRNLPHIAVLD